MTSPAAHSSNSYGRERTLRRRLASLAISVLINLLILWVLLTLAPRIQGTQGHDGKLTTFNVSNDNSQSNSAKQSARAAKAAAAKAQPRSSIPPPIVPPKITLPRQLTPFIEISPEQYKTTDISKLHSDTPAQSQGEAASAGSSGAPGDSELTGGAGPNGEPLYRAEWYREPTDAELRFYLPKRGVPRGSWAEIACQTMPRFHVDNCIPLADSPPGSGLARAIQQAGWQFLVRPPRVGGKTLVGAWVRIRISFTREDKDPEP